MKRDFDLIREILLEIEEKGDGLSGVNFPQNDNISVSHVKYIGHIIMLESGGFIDGVNIFDSGASVSRITYQGYEFLEGIRDPEIWKKTKDNLIELKNFSFDTVKKIGKAYLKQKIKEKTNLDIE